MNLKITYEIEEKILQLVQNGMTHQKIADTIGVSRKTIHNILKKNRVPENEFEIKKIDRKKCLLTNLIDIRLLYFCNDIELLCTMFKNQINDFDTKEIVIPKRLKNIIPINKKLEKICVQFEKKYRVK